MLAGARPPLQYNGYEELIRDMGRHDNKEGGGMDEDAAADVQFAALSNMYIKDKTWETYEGGNKRLLLWLDKEQPNCVSEAAKRELSETYKKKKKKKQWFTKN